MGCLASISTSEKHIPGLHTCTEKRNIYNLKLKSHPKQLFQTANGTSLHFSVKHYSETAKRATLVCLSLSTTVCFIYTEHFSSHFLHQACSTENSAAHRTVKHLHILSNHTALFNCDFYSSSQEWVQYNAAGKELSSL